MTIRATLLRWWQANQIGLSFSIVLHLLLLIALSRLVVPLFYQDRHPETCQFVFDSEMPGHALNQREPQRLAQVLKWVAPLPESLKVAKRVKRRLRCGR